MSKSPEHAEVGRMARGPRAGLLEEVIFERVLGDPEWPGWREQLSQGLEGGELGVCPRGGSRARGGRLCSSLTPKSPRPAHPPPILRLLSGGSRLNEARNALASQHMLILCRSGCDGSCGLEGSLQSAWLLRGVPAPRSGPGGACRPVPGEPGSVLVGPLPHGFLSPDAGMGSPWACLPTQPTAHPPGHSWQVQAGKLELEEFQTVVKQDCEYGSRGSPSTCLGGGLWHLLPGLTAPFPAPPGSALTFRG